MSEEKKPSKILIDHVSKWYPTQSQMNHALEDVSLDVADGEFVCLLGPSGCGKSTLLNLIAGLDFPDHGQVLFNGTPVVGPGNDRVLMLQEAALFPWLTVFENVMFGLKLKTGLTNMEREEIAMSYLELVELAKFKNSNVHELSGGMKHRLALVRALALDPKVLLMDEPFAALDALTREQIYADIQWLWKKHKKTIIFVTHNVAESVCLGDRVILFSPTPGRNRKEFKITLPRSRDVRSIEVAQYVHEIIEELRRLVPMNVIERVE